MVCCQNKEVLKKIFWCLVLLLLSACVRSDDASLKSDLDTIFSDIDSIKIYQTNNDMTFYSYYLPSSMGEDEVDSDSITLKYGSSKIIMNLNVADIINAQYYSDQYLSDDGFFNDDYLFYEKTGTYLSYQDIEKQYIYRLYKHDNNYLLHLKTSDMNYYGSVKISDIKDVTRELLVIAKSTRVLNDEVISTYSNKEVISYQKKQIDLFETTMPNNGQLSDMLVDGALVGNENNNSQESDNQEEQKIF